MKILISNDDGIDAPGLVALAKAFVDGGDEVYVCAPLKEQSGMAHAMTVHRAMELVKRDDFVAAGAKVAFALDGTPTDCVKAFLEFLNNEEMSAVVSGINRGANLATDVLYSGTVGAALEGFLHTINSFAVSVDVASSIPLEEVAACAADFVRRQTRRCKDEPRLLNINFPKKFRDGRAIFKPAVLGERDYINAFVAEKDEGGRTFISIRGEIFDRKKDEDTDIFATEQGFVAVSELTIDIAERRIFADDALR